MIHVFIGTKAQFIKMAPIMKEMQKRRLAYNYINSGQHAALTEQLIREFEIRKPDASLRKEISNIQSIPQALLWVIKCITWLVFYPKKIFKEIYKNKNGICLIHGDTVTTLISLVYAKRFGMPVYHVEAGLRSYNLLNPFPEEIIRLVAMKFSDRLFAPSEWAYQNLCRMGYHEKSINIGANTGQDAVCYAAQRNAGALPNSPYVVATIHRFETIFSIGRLSKIVSVLERLSGTYQVVWVLHEATDRQLQNFGLFERIRRIPDIRILPVLPYLDFIALIAGSDFVISDGGSIQEECYYLNKPCLVMRMKTERLEGLGENVFLCGFDVGRLEYFFEHIEQFERKYLFQVKNPSRIIVDELTESATNKA